MNELFAAAGEVQDLCTAEGWRFCFIGGLAVQRWGEARVTRGVDLTLITGFGGEDAFVPEIAPLRTRSAEDLVVHKVFAGRDRDWSDVGGVITRQRHRLDVDLIVDEVTALLEAKGAMANLDRLPRLLDGAAAET